eukprot:SAG11_NODE_12373_length_706_cov_2.479407_1_plen_38_part_10
MTNAVLVRRAATNEEEWRGSGRTAADEVKRFVHAPICT